MKQCPKDLMILGAIAEMTESVNNFVGGSFGLNNKGNEAIAKLNGEFSESRLPVRRRTFPFLYNVLHCKI